MPFEKRQRLKPVEMRFPTGYLEGFMKTFRYDTSANWYKGNTHLHSTASDGGKTPLELAAIYAEGGYDFLFRTDHWIASDVQTEETTEKILWLDGIELNGKDHGGSAYHVVCLGTFNGITKEIGFVAAMEAARAQGALLILAHPDWMGNSIEDALRWGFDGVEVYNHVCRWLNGKGSGLVYWHAMLERSPDTLGLSVDDAHLRPEHAGWNGGWIVVNAKERSRESIIDAIRAGNFYSSCGPEIHSLAYDGVNLTVQSSPIQFIRLVGPRSLGKRLGSFVGETRTETTLEVPQDWGYVYLEIEDTQGRRAWTNTLFTKIEAASI